MRVLELFKGSGSVTKYYLDKPDVEVISLDILKKYKPTIVADIMDWDYKKYEPGYFDIIWASPECKVFSSLQHTNIGRKWKDMAHLNQVRSENAHFINRTIDIIKYLNPKKYFIENPKNSAIWKYVEDKEFLKKDVIVDYCYFGYVYKKPTRILTNGNYENKRCGHKNHRVRLGINNKTMFGKGIDGINDTSNLMQRYSIPPRLLEYLLG